MKKCYNLFKIDAGYTKKHYDLQHIEIDVAVYVS